MHPPLSAVVLSIDRLGAGHLGPYGNTWLPTPHFNRLASQSILCETTLCDSPDLSAAFRAWWTGRHFAEPNADAGDSLIAQARERGLTTLLITDDAEVTRFPLADQFDEHLLVEPLDSAACAEAIEETGLFHLFQAAIEALAERPQPLLAWIHTRGMAGPWDAPYEFRTALADEDDPAPPTFVTPPEQRAATGFDPDEVLGYVHAYGGQVQLVDECLGRLLDALDAHPQRDYGLLAVTSPRGYPLGEHGRVGPCDGALYNELVHVPLLVRLPRAGATDSDKPTREFPRQLAQIQRPTQPADLCATLIETCGWGVVPPQYAARNIAAAPATGNDRRPVALIHGPQQRALRTPAWYLRESADDSGPNQELFAKPDDRWEVNEVASRCGDITPLLAAEQQSYEQALASGSSSALPPLADSLTEISR